jgi:hypothetical protein
MHANVKQIIRRNSHDDCSEKAKVTAAAIAGQVGPQVPRYFRLRIKTKTEEVTRGTSTEPKRSRTCCRRSRSRSEPS